MHILLDQSAHDMRNKGNNALLEVAASRFMKYWPDASFDIITLAPQITRLYYPWSRPVAPEGLYPFGNKTGKIFNWVPKYLLWIIFELREEWFHRRMVTLQQRNGARESVGSGVDQAQKMGEAVKEKDFSVASNHKNQQALRETISCYDLVVASGGGYFCDSDKPRLLKVFDRLEAAVRQNIPTVMVGQGIGPLDDRQLQERAGQVLPKLDLVCVREQRVALPILEKLGVPSGKIRMTGDDAIELAYQGRVELPGRGIGLSIRISTYTQINDEHIKAIRSVIHTAAGKYKAPLVAVPISSAPHESDIAHIRALMKGYSPQSVGWRKLDTPLDSIKMAGQCRIMLAGTYHGAIFSLAQGIPVIGLAKSDEYFYKLSGLTDEFGPGCRILHIDDQNLETKLATVLDELWNSADELRPDLLSAAEKQIKLGYEAYDQIFRIVSERSY